MNELIYNIIKDRLSRRLKSIAFDIGEVMDGESFYIAGNSLNSMEPNDYDIFKVSSDMSFDVDNKEVITSTKNAITIKTKFGKILQFCNYYHNSLKELVDSFDFAHIKLGAKVKFIDGGFTQEDYYEIEELYISEDYLVARGVESTFYTGSKYPISSLMRLIKYQKRGDFAGKSYTVDVLKILGDIISLKLKDYSDFKDQMAAVDLGLLEEDESNAAYSLWTTMLEKLKIGE